MMKQKFLFLFIFSLFMTTSYSQAGLLVEPLIGLNITGEGGDDDLDNMPITYGARLGYQNLGLMLGLDYQKTDAIKYDSSSEKYDLSETGVFVGYNFPILVRAWLGYTFKATNEGPGLDLSGKGTKIGVGFTGLPFVSINLEFKKQEYDENGSTDLSPKIKGEMMLLSVSLPLTF